MKAIVVSAISPETFQQDLQARLDGLGDASIKEILFSTTVALDRGGSAATVHYSALLILHS